jgi:pimeloyl-ACP methyl ester carboxylesterase
VAAVAAVAVTLLTLNGPGLMTKVVVVLIAAATVASVWRWQARWTGAPLLVWGLLGTALGVAAGMRHVLAGQWGLAPIAACVAAVAGVFLLVSGSVRLLRGLHWAGQVLGIVGITAISLIGLYMLVIPFLTTQPLRGDAPAAAPDGFRETAFVTSDGVTLRGWYADGDNGAGVVVVPGAGSSREAAREHARVLAEAGYAVLVYDPRGHGTSDGTAMDLGWAGDLDVRAAVDTVASQPGVRTVGALGLSMGGEQVLGAAATDTRIAAVVAEGATNRVAADLRWLSAQYGARGSVQVRLEQAKQAITAGLTPYPAPPPLRDALAAIAPRPVLLITAGARPDEGFAAQYNAGEQPTVVIWEVPGATHTGALRTDRAAWADEVVGFFDRTLR